MEVKSVFNYLLWYVKNNFYINEQINNIYKKVTMKRALMKTLGIIVILLLIIPSTVYSQVYKLKTTSFSSRIKHDDGSWSEWSELQENSILITFDQTNDRIKIYSKVTQVYDIVEYKKMITDSDNDDIYTYYCVDVKGLNCYVKWVKLNSQNGRMQMYVTYNDMEWLYNIYSLD
jgi:hypothetical protein